MNMLSLSLRSVFILSIAIMVPLPSVASVQQAEPGHSNQQGYLQLLTKSWQSFETAITESFNDVVEFVQDVFHLSHHTAPQYNFDVTLVGFVNFADGIGRHPILFKQCFGDQVKMNFLSTRNFPPELEDAQLGLPRLNPANKADIGAIAILTDIIADQELNLYSKMPDSLIKIAYTMFEATEIPCNWAAILNQKFDMAVVPDPFFVDVYKKCGVTIPIFVLPLPLMLHDFLKIQRPATSHKPFVFGLSGGFWPRKNHIRVLEAFAAEFGNSPDVKLRLHGRFGEGEIIGALADTIKKYNLTNVELIVKPYTWDEYLAFYQSLDCYTFLSLGEGFSISPREALACGMPCILTNNTAQITICNSGFVRVVPSNIPIPGLYDCHYGSDHGCEINRFMRIAVDQDNMADDINLPFRSGRLGYQFDCTLQDARAAMRDVYQNYTYYLNQAAQGRAWVKQYLCEHLSKKYVNLVKPKTVVFGVENTIRNNFLMTNSKALYEKYQYLLGK